MTDVILFASAVTLVKQEVNVNVQTWSYTDKSEVVLMRTCLTLTSQKRLHRFLSFSQIEFHGYEECSFHCSLDCQRQNTRNVDTIDLSYYYKSSIPTIWESKYCTMLYGSCHSNDLIVLRSARLMVLHCYQKWTYKLSRSSHLAIAIFERAGAQFSARKLKSTSYLSLSYLPC